MYISDYGNIHLKTFYSELSKSSRSQFRVIKIMIERRSTNGCLQYRTNRKSPLALKYLLAGRRKASVSFPIQAGDNVRL